MPTYTRTADTTALVEAADGSLQIVYPGRTIETFKVLSTGWSKVSDEPYFALAEFSQAITAPGTVTGLAEYRIIRVTAGSDGITMTANVATNPYSYPLTGGVSLDIENRGEIDALVFTGSGDVTVIAIPE